LGDTASKTVLHRVAADSTSPNDAELARAFEVSRVRDGTRPRPPGVRGPTVTTGHMQFTDLKRSEIKLPRQNGRRRMSRPADRAAGEAGARRNSKARRPCAVPVWRIKGDMS
jgi:hypothetical protein